MPKVLDTTFSFEEMKKRWNADNPDEPYSRPSVPSWYDLDTWIIRVDDNNRTISTTGWKEYPEYIMVGGTKSISDSPKGHMSDLIPFRSKTIPNKPLLATFTNAPRWIEANEKTGWQIKNIKQDLLNSIPKSIISNMRDYSEKNNKAWGIKPSSELKKWMRILKIR